MLASHESLALEVRVVLLGERCTLKDGQNSVRKVVDTTGTVVASYDYDAWGNTLSDPNAIDVLFHHRAFGEVHDPDLGMTYLRARWMDPGTGRFESRDPVAGRREDPKSLQPYAYAHLDPNLLADPTGQFTLVQMLVTVGVAAIFTAIPIPALAQTRDKANHAADLARRLSRAKGHPSGVSAVRTASYRLASRGRYRRFIASLAPATCSTRTITSVT
ncbi:MAG: hypothetical protein IPK07_14245 [Deltaproteobacteria bacterium]|nr:hypothetical protein [Deltaproteobacteria bacterium]